MKKRRYIKKRRFSKKFQPILILVVIFSFTGILLFLFQDSDLITGHVIETNPELSAEVSASAVQDSTVPETDVSVWQGQYHTSKNFNTGTYEFNFTVYDAKSGGGRCYSNTTTLTTGDFGEWITEQSGVGAACNNASQDYFLNINIDGVDQGKRRRLTIWSFLRKDSNLKLTGPTTIINNIQTGGSSPTALLLQNIASNTTAATVFRVSNEIGKFTTIAMGSNKTTFANITGSQGVLSYNGGNSFSFSMINFPASWIWRNTFSPSLNNVTIDKLMELTKTGSLILYHGNLSVNGNINTTGNITGIGGFFSYLGSSVNRITNLWVQEIDAININTTNITAVQYNSVDAGEPKTGLTSSQFSVCKKFKVPENTCEEWCKLEITGGIITNCK